MFKNDDVWVNFKQCREMWEKNPCRKKLCRLESKAGFSQSFELAHYSAAAEQFFEELFFSQHHLPFLLWPFFSTHSSLSFLALSCVLFGKNWENDDQLSPLFVTNVICAKVRNGYWPLENFQTKELPLDKVFSRVLGSSPAVEKMMAMRIWDDAWGRVI